MYIYMYICIYIYIYSFACYKMPTKEFRNMKSNQDKSYK